MALLPGSLGNMDLKAKAFVVIEQHLAGKAQYEIFNMEDWTILHLSDDKAVQGDGESWKRSVHAVFLYQNTGKSSILENPFQGLWKNEFKLSNYRRDIS